MNTSSERIQQYWLEIKGLTDAGIAAWGLVILIAIVGLGSFALGRFSALEDARPPVSLQMAPESSSISGIPLGGELVASSGGHTYYYPWCSGAQSIKEGNQVWFASEKEAQAAGFAPAKGCKGLAPNQQ